MSYDLDLVIRYGQKVGADFALIKNDTLKAYYKKGDKNSKYCLYFCARIHPNVDLRWSNSFNYCLEPVIKFYRDLGHNILVIDIPKKVTPD